MDTNHAIVILEGRNTILAASISAQQQEFDANTLAISQLKGTLTTQLESLADDQVQTFPVVRAIIADRDGAKAALEEANTAHKAAISALQTKLEAIKALVPPADSSTAVSAG